MDTQLKADNLIEVPLERIVVSPFQPRRHFAKGELEELAQSIRAVGLIHPPVVRYLPETDQYELVSGERRFRAAELAGKRLIPVVVRQSSSMDAAQAALIENIQRVDLNPIEIAKALKSLIEKFSWTQEELSKRVGKKRSTVANYIRLLSLPKDIQDSLINEEITMGHAKAILSVEGFEKQALLHDLVRRDDLNVRQAEEMALRIGDRVKKPLSAHPKRDFYVEDLVSRLQQKFGTKVSFVGNGKQGKICIDYYSLDDLDRLLQLFGFDNC
ncbi:MAG: ParB/RepB/Spo0J family partition protein [Parachlamydia sp.]|nr:ParB/RepB/Spo0J family partition protein [Parachlamydia sp.]